MRNKILTGSAILIFILAPGLYAYERIVSIIPSVTKSLYLLGLEDKIVGVTIYCPPAAKDKEKIGNVLEPDIEKIVSLKPDLVLASEEGNRLVTVNTLKSLGLKVYYTHAVNSIGDIDSDFIKLGRFLGAGAKANDIVRTSQKRIAALKDRKKTGAAPTVFLEVGAQPLFTAGKLCFLNDIIEAAGGKNIFLDTDQRFPQVSREEIIRRDPDVIVLIAMGDVTQNETTSWSEFKGLKAVKTGRIYVVNDSSFTDPTPKSAADAAEKLAALLYP